MPNYKERSTCCDFPITGYRLTIVITSNIKKAYNNRLTIFKSEFKDNQPLGLFGSLDHKQAGYIFLKPDSDVNTIAHESFHAVCHMMTMIGSTLDDSSEENYAYPLGYICELVDNFIKSVKKDFKKKKNDKKDKKSEPEQPQ